jgi:hypothetical protein
MTETTKVDEPIVYVRRQWSDWSVGTVRLSSIDGLHMDNVSGGVKTVAPRAFLHGYILCTDIIDGGIAHSCRHGPPPHNIKVCIVQCDNDRDIYASLRQSVESGWTPRKRKRSGSKAQGGPK